MQVVSVNRGRAQALRGRSFNGTTGIFKQPVAETVAVDALGLSGDAVCNKRHHGGPDQALYLYREEDYRFWSDELGREVAPGEFGDNLTVSGLPEPGLAIGSRLRLPDLLLEVTAPRIPCNTLAERMQDPGFVRAFFEAERPGIYLRVIEPGTVADGQACELEPFAGEQVSTIELFRASRRKLDATALRRFLAVPIDMRTRAKFEAQLSKLA